MIIFFEILKILFFVFSIAMGLFFLRGYYYLQDTSFTSLTHILMPAYLVLAGLMVGYMCILYYKTRAGEAGAAPYVVKGFIGGLVIGVAFALVYIFAI